jgi:hypothetical protein
MSMTIQTMTLKWMSKPGWLGRIGHWLDAKQDWPPEVRRARELVAAVDKGGLPLNPMKVNQIARDLGLEVSTRAPVEDTIERIRRALDRA